ncbi:uncharacterized protein [Nicotiana sylvestris]|uniref:uncharacterized protein n=1 Tax=Nicotiana sylvestris TaxID=4096 RepID=UPI00388C635F
MRDVVQLLTRLVDAQAWRQEASIGHSDRSVSARVHDFINLDPPVFTGADPNEDPQVFIDRVQRTLQVMKATVTKSVKLASNRLRDVAANWYEFWELSRGENAPPAVWQEFTEAFLRHYLPPELRRSRVDRFLTLRQGNMSIWEYSLQFDSLARYAPTIVSKMEDRAYTQGVKERKHKQRADREHDRAQNKRARSSSPSDFVIPEFMFLTIRYIFNNASKEYGHPEGKVCGWSQVKIGAHLELLQKKCYYTSQ